MLDIFDKFYHQDKLIHPLLSNDWKITASNKIDHINLYSKKLDQLILIHVNKLVSFLNDGNYFLTDDYFIVGDFIINRFLDIVPKDEYLAWKKSIDMSKKIANKHLKVGYVYTLDNGLKCVYLGSRYVSELLLDKYISFDRISDIFEKKYILLYDEVVELNEFIFEDSELKILTEEEATDKLNSFYETNHLITYFSDKKIENPTYGFISTSLPSPFLKIGDKYYTKVQNANNIQTCWLFGAKYIKNDLKFEFELELSGKDFSYGQCIPITQNKSNDISLVRIGVVS